MKVVAVGGLAVAIGLLVGTLGGGIRVRSGILETLADSVAAHEVSLSDSHPTGATEEQATPSDLDSSDYDEPSQAVDFVDQPVGEGTEVPAEAPSPGGASTAEEMAAATAAAAADSLDRVAVEEGARKLSRIFGAMDPKDAASVLQLLENEEIEMIMSHMTERLAAPILEVFDPERAAELSRIVLSPRRSES